MSLGANKFPLWRPNWDADGVIHTDPGAPVGLPPSSQMPRPGPAKRFVRWLSAIALKRPRAWIADEVRAITRAERERSAREFVRAMEETSALLLSCISGARPVSGSAPASAAPISPKKRNSLRLRCCRLLPHCRRKLMTVECAGLVELCSQ